MNFDGSQRTSIVQGNVPHPFALTLQGDYIYWTDWTAKAIHSCNKNTGSRRRQVLGGSLSPMDIHVYSATRQPAIKTACDYNNGNCSHLCLLSSNANGYSCACPTGVKLLLDEKNCSPGAEKFLLLARRVDIRRISLDTSDHTDVVLPLKGIKHAIAIDFDYVENRIYWSDDDVHVIRRAFLNGSQQEDVIVTEVHHPDGIAVDPIARNIYWTDTGTDRIEVARLNGSSRKILVTEGLDEPRAIVVHAQEGLMYWTDWGAKPKIEKAGLDGSNRQILVSSNLGWPNGIAIDYEFEKLYWSDAKLDKIEVADMDGSNRRELVADQLPHIFGFTLLDDFVYWTDWQRRSIERVNKINGQDREAIIDQLPDLMGLKAVSVHQNYGNNPCATNNNQCSHLCLYTPLKSSYCACPMGFELSTDLKTCVIPEAFLLIARRTEIRRISLQSNHQDLIPIGGIQEQKIAAFDYDITDNRIYWTDVRNKVISRSFINGSSNEHIIEFGLEYPADIAIDWVARNLYWTDMTLNHIEVSRLDGSQRKVLIWKDLDRPKSLLLSPNEAAFYWSNWGAVPHIEKASLDGTHRLIIIHEVRAQGLTLDFTENRLFWTNSDQKTIESANLDGTKRTVIISENLSNPYGLTVYEGFVYWSDWENNSIEKANKLDGSNRTLVHTHLEDVVDVVIYHNSRQIGWNPCAVNNGGCSHLCLATSNYGNKQVVSYHCACPTHYKLNEDNKTCSGIFCNIIKNRI